MTSSIWTEKYRPQTFDEVKGQKNIVAKIKAFVETGNMPHLLFAGPAGVGKTTLSLVIAKQLFGENWRQNTLELNASDERGIDVVRVKVKDFARTRSLGNVPFKLIYLDESDALTKDAQQALRRTMENYTKTCRFILSCNYSSKIIDPIQSRCAVFRFKPLPESEIYLVIDKIVKQEGLSISED
ncbi:replication factor C small subunit, partial [Candidatus Woesearchaeota archaeon]|nr:replication factor C small subunit [Candidatus Woesearchaeota archaeon]